MAWFSSSVEGLVPCMHRSFLIAVLSANKYLIWLISFMFPRQIISIVFEMSFTKTFEELAISAQTDGIFLYF